MNLHSPGWFKRYIAFRFQDPLPAWLSFDTTITDRTQTFGLPDIDRLDDLFYDTVRKSGILFGSPVLAGLEADPKINKRLLNDLDQARLVNMEVLFTCLINEIKAFAPALGDYSTYFTRAVVRTIQFYLGKELDSRFFDQDLSTLLKDRRFSNILKSFERRFSRRVKILTKFTLVNTLQNSAAFFDIYGLVQWNRLFNNQSKRPVYFLKEIEKDHIKIQRQICLIFAAIIWHTESETEHLEQVKIGFGTTSTSANLLTSKKHRMLRRYIETTRLPYRVKRELIYRASSPIEPNITSLSIQEPIIVKYMLEQTILLSLINSDTDPFQISFIRELANLARLDDDELRARISSVTEFFYENEDRFDFIRGSRALRHMKDNLNQRLAYIIRKNLNRLITEIKRTGELYALLSRHDGNALTPEEKRFVKEQLLSIAKTIPALAIFCLPAGSMVLAVLIKLLPFNILPNSFAD